MAKFDKIIWVSWINPEIAKGGGGAYSRSVLQSLKSNFPETEIIYIHRDNDGYVSPMQKIERTLRYSHRYPMKIAFGLDTLVGRRLRHITSRYPNSLVVFNGAETFGYLDFVSSGTKLHVSHNVEHELYLNRITKSKYGKQILAAVLKEADKFKKYEIEGISRFDYVTFISPEDQFVISSLLADKMPRSTVVQPTFNDRRTEKAVRETKKGVSVAFMADFTWTPNAEGISHFIDHRWHPEGADVLHLFGRESEKYSDTAKSIVAHGWVPDLKLVWELSDVMIAPIYWGGGVNIKTCEAIYQGIPLVATPLAVRGIPDLVKRETTVIVRDDDWMSAIRKASPPSRASSMFFSSENAHNTISELFGSKIIKEDISNEHF